MTPLIKGMVTAAAFVVAAGAGLWAGQTGLIKLPIACPVGNDRTWRSPRPPARSSITATPTAGRSIR